MAADNSARSTSRKPSIGTLLSSNQLGFAGKEITNGNQFVRTTKKR